MVVNANLDFPAILPIAIVDYATKVPIAYSSFKHSWKDDVIALNPCILAI